MLLHTVNKSPYHHTALKACAETCATDDAVVLMEDGVYGLSHPDLSLILGLSTKVFAIEADCLARGIAAENRPECERISYEKFVALCTENPKQMSWS